MRRTCHDRFSVEEINRRIQTDALSLVQEAESAFYHQIIQIADHVADERQHYKILLVAGPSASGKTTVSDMLCKALEQRGVQSLCISLDNFFLNRHELPKLPNGETDHESIDTICFPVLYQCYEDLFQHGETYLPTFDFESGMRRDHVRKVSLHADDVLILEGIHALHPRMLTPDHTDQFFRIYVSADTDYADENGQTVLSSQNLRLIRRMIRDSKHRSASAARTFEMWGNVCQAEKQYILPLQSQADVKIHTVHSYEPAVYRTYLCPLLAELPPSSIYDKQRHALLAMLEQFTDLPYHFVPSGSLLQEFLE